MMEEFEYYLLRRKTDKAYPLINMLNENSDIMEIEIGAPVPRNPVMADYLRGAKDFFKKHIADAMQAMNMEGVRFIPTKLSDRKGNITDDYICVKVDSNTYEALDKERSDYTIRRDRYIISKVVLDRKVLQDISLNKRLGFRLREAPGYYLYHKSVIETIQALNPTGVYFVNIEEFNEF